MVNKLTPSNDNKKGELRYLIIFLYLFFLLFAIDFGLNPLWDFLNKAFEIKIENNYGDEKRIIFIISAIILAPLIETLVFQTFIKHLLDFTFLKNSKKKTILYSIISGGLFGISHIYSITHIIKASLIGFFFMFYFLKIRNTKIGFLLIYFTHAFWNFFVWIYRNY